MKRPELLAPAGDLSKLKTAILYGADAVFIGGKQFSLRAKASNFTLEDIKEAVLFAHQHHAKVHVTVNIYPHQKDLEGIDEYLKALSDCHVDAIIVSSPFIVKRAKILGCQFEIHISTQQSVANSEAIRFFKELGASRVVLARECDLWQIKSIVEQKITDIEVFIHGGLCSSYSGRCTLSNNMTNRDANRGGCAHSCRWAYDIYEQGKQINDSASNFMIGSKDLLGVKAITKLIDIGVDSLKIEGRMKSLHYIATVVSSYRRLIDYYMKKQTIEEEQINSIITEIRKAENRETTLAYLKNEITIDDIIYDNEEKTASQEFIGVILDYDKNTHLARVLRKNYLTIKSEIEVLHFDGTTKSFILDNMFDENMVELEIANQSDQIILMEIPFEVSKDYLLRKREKNE